jgi:Ca2+-transporting ATPase
MLRILHSKVPGRARFKVDALYRAPGLQHYLERELADVDSIHSVTANPLTGSVKVTSDPILGPMEVAHKLEILVADYQRQDCAPHQGSSMAIPSQSREPHHQPVQADTPWHTQTTEAIISAHNTDLNRGLSPQEAGQRLERYGPNRLATVSNRSDVAMVVEQLTTWPVGLLSTAAVLSLATGSPIDAVVIMGVVGINTVIGYVTESQSERIIQSLQQDQKPLARVMRDGQTMQLDATEVVPGDLMLLQSGQTVAADARLVDVSNLTVDESALTGESLPVRKLCAPLAQETPLAERTNQVFKGTLIAGGQGKAVVTGTGQNTEIGRIQTLVGTTAALETPLQRQLGEVSGQLVLLCGGVCAVIFGVGALRGYGLLHGLKNSISLAVAAVPEGLPAVATTTLALGIQRMRQRKILIRALNAVEALGSVQVVCLDKTGTITQNYMVVQAIHLPTGSMELEDGKLRQGRETLAAAASHLALTQLLEIGVLCSESDVAVDGNNRITVQGSATENALIHLALGADLDVLDLRQRYPTNQVNLRSDNRNVMSTLHETPEGKRLAAVKGSPREVLQRCTRWRHHDQILPLTESTREDLIQANYYMADQSLRVLALAYRDLEDGDEDGEHDLIWLGMVGMADPIRAGVPELMTAFHRAGIDTVMLTGDQRSTARAIGQRLSLSRNGGLTVLDAQALAQLGDDGIKQQASKVDIFARISPADKLQIVRALQSANKVVAMTGDGINDTPALKAANVGLAMGSGKSEGVHEVADVVIQDDNLSTLIDAVSQGRTIYTNIRKAVHFLLATNLSEIVVVAIATLAGLGEPLNAIQLLWLNLVTDIFPGLGLALEPPEPDVLEQPPRNPEERIIKTSDFQRIAWEASVISAAALAAYGYALARYGIGAQSSTVAFMSLTLAQVLHTFSCRSETHRWFDARPLPRNPYVEAAIAGSLALQLLPLVVPGLGQLLHIVPLDARDYGVIALAALLPLVINELTKSGEPGPENSAVTESVTDHPENNESSVKF